MRQLECHEEEIHLCGKIQFFGFLCIFNESGCIAASENLSSVLEIPMKEILGRSIGQLLPLLSSEQEWNLKEIERQITGEIFTRFVERIRIKGVDYYLSIYRYDDKTYVEVEICSENHLKATRLFYYAKYLEEQHGNAWQSLTVLIRQIIGFDRVMVYRLEEDGSGQVIAESLAEDMTSLLGYRYPEFDIPKQARELYRTKHCRFVVDTHDEGSIISSLEGKEINLQDVSIRRLSPIHLQYLKNAGFRSSISFSIMIKGELWGLVCCQNESPKHVDLSIRNFSLLATNFAANKFQQLEDNEIINYLKEVQELELQLKEKVLLKSNIFLELKDFSKTLIQMLEADGIAIGFKDSIFLDGLHPEKETLRSQIPKLSELSKNHIFTTHALSSQNNIYEAFGKSIAGLTFASIDNKKDFFIIWFRKEIPLNKDWAGKPEKFYL